MDIEAGGGKNESTPLNTPPLARAKSSRDNKTKGKVLPVTSHFHLTPEQYYQGDHTKELRAGFIRKVYTLLSFQMLLTVGICYSCMYVDSLRDFILNNTNGCFYGFLIPMIISLVALMCNKDRVPTNYFWFFSFTVFMSLYIGIICAMYSAAGYGILVLEALCLTAGLFIGLTFFTCVSGFDFSGMGPYLFSALWLLILYPFVGWLFGFYSRFLYCLFGLILFSFYVIYDTSNIMHKFGYDDYLIAAIELYLDIINLFLMILQILSGSRR
mmetsp:Transcript_30767/g.40649  ORF Transcript_30767/g.40649 Transcript_30767/m.40649 type:complete len:270 (-) Transcript_30767:227-1036(-)